MTNHTEEQRNKNLENHEPRMCICGENESIGAWGLRVGYRAPYGFTGKMGYCKLHLPDMIDGLSLVVKDLKQIQKRMK